MSKEDAGFGLLVFFVIVVVGYLRALAKDIAALRTELNKLTSEMRYLLHDKYPEHPGGDLPEPYLSEIVKQLNSILLALDRWERSKGS